MKPNCIAPACPPPPIFEALLSRPTPKCAHLGDPRAVENTENRQFREAKPLRGETPPNLSLHLEAFRA